MDLPVNGFYLRFLKPFSDRVFSFMFFILTLPALCLIAAANLWLRFPVFFTQNRPGLNGKSFTIRKFCTIHPATGELSPIGSFLRKYSLDELPQLFNVMAGNMSLVGPRPLLMEYMELYTCDEQRRHLVKPGITGLAQVSGRNELSLKEKVRIDLVYVDTISFRVDFKILMKTFGQVFIVNEADGHFRFPSIKNG